MPSSPKQFDASRLGKKLAPWEPPDFSMEAVPHGEVVPGELPNKERRAADANVAGLKFTILSPDDWPTAQAANPSAETQFDGALKVFRETSQAGQVASWEPPELDFAYPVLFNKFGGIREARAFSVETEAEWQTAGQKIDEMLQQAEAQARELLESAAAEAAEITRQALEEANEVKRQAISDGVAAANAETRDMLRAATAIVGEVNAWRESLIAGAEMDLLRLVIEIAQSIFGEGLPLEPEALGQAFSRALSEAKTLGDLRIYAHPEDVAVLGPHWARQQAAISGQSIELIASDIIKRGGCFVEGQYGSVDARVESQLKIAQDTLLAAYPHLGEAAK